MIRILYFLTIFYISIGNANNTKFLSIEELKWIHNFDRSIKIGVTKIPNQVLPNKDKSLRGFSIDIFDIIKKKSNLQFEYIYYNSWKELVEASKKREIDILFLAQKTSSRLKYLYFTDTVITQQNKIVVHVGTKINSLDDLRKKKVAITEGSAIEEYIRHYYPEIIMVPTQSELQSLEFVSQKKADATVLELVRASYYIRKHNLDELIITEDIDYNYYLSIASSKELPELNLILSKTLKSISKSEIDALKLKWGYIKEKKLFFDTQTMIYLAIAFGIIIPFSIYLFLINKRLKIEMKEKEKALTRVTKLRDSKFNEISQIISMISHQWKQPVNNLSLINQMLQMKYKKGKLDEEVLEYFFKNSKIQIDLMVDTINDFRDFFKVDEEKRSFDLKEMIVNLIKITQPIYAKNNIEILFEVNDDDFEVENFQSMLFQIIINILNNAKDVLEDKNQVLKLIKIKLEKQKNEKVIQILDNGGGIPDEIIDRIFDPYFSTKQEQNGTGLGLYMAKIIVEERMQGKLSVENKDDGALFSIHLM